MQTVLNIARADWGPALRAAAGRAAYVVAALIVATEITYRAGLATGRALHWLSDRLGGLASGRIDRAQTARAVVAWAHGVIDAPAPVDVVAPDAPDAPDAPVSLAETFAAAAAAAAASDARLYRSASETIARVSALLDQAEALEDAAAGMVEMACAVEPASPQAGLAAPSLDGLTVAQLRKLARARGLSGLAHKGRRADLLAALAG